MRCQTEIRKTSDVSRLQYGSVSPTAVDTRPRLVGDGEVEFSTCLDLERPYHLVWDVNGYYAALGIPTDATRLQIREAYQRLEGWNSDRLTYIAKQLLDPETRAKYDKAPIGSILVDYWVKSAMARALAQKNISLMAAGLVSYESLYEARDKEDEDVVDRDPWSEQYGDLKPAEPGKEGTDWSHYLWGTEREGPEVSQVMDWWRNLLSVEIGIRGQHLRLAVGLFGDLDFQEQWRVHRVGYRLVVFLGDHPMDLMVSESIPSDWKIDFLREIARSCAHELSDIV